MYTYCWGSVYERQPREIYCQEQETENSWLRYLNNMSIQGTPADELIIQTVADVLKVTIQILYNNPSYSRILIGSRL